MANLRVGIAIAAAVGAHLAFAAPAPDGARAELTVFPTNLIVTETATATIHLHLPPFKGQLADHPPFSSRFPPSFAADFIPRDRELRLHTLRERRNNENWWHYTLAVPVKATKAGRIELQSVRVRVPDPNSASFFSFGEPTRLRWDLVTNPAHFEAHEPPEAGRPDSYCGAICRRFSAVAKLDAIVCTAGDPLTLTVDVTGDFEADAIRPPSVAALNGSAFKPDMGSFKAKPVDGGRRYTWRVRAVKAGTGELPAIPISYYDIAKRMYVAANTEPIPVQVKAGAQVSLGNFDDGEEEAFPMPDGLDFPPPGNGKDDFTLRRALSLATHATTAKDFAAAAAAYSDYLESTNPKGADAALHYSNLGAILYFAEKPRESLAAFTRAERAVGATPASIRGVKAAIARMKNDPRADLPLARTLFPFYFRYSLKGRIAFAALAALGTFLLFFLAAKCGRRLSVLAAAATIAGAAQAQFHFNFARMGGGGGAVSATARLEPASPVTGEQAVFVLSFKTEKGEKIDETLNVMGLPGPSDGAHYSQMTRISDTEFKLPVRFLAPFSNELSLVAHGMAARETSSGNFHSVSKHSFSAAMPPFNVHVRPLPAAGRPADFSGAIGRRFRLRERLEPSTVHPGDLVTATYVLEFDGYAPDDLVPKLSGLGKDFKAYELKEVEKTPRSRTWRQMLVPETTNAVAGAIAEIPYYDLDRRAYSVARAVRPRLTFLSAEAASTENTSVLVDAPAAAVGAATGSDRSVELHFAPSDSSPKIATLPPGVPTRETARRNGWIRLESDRAAGWAREK